MGWDSTRPVPWQQLIREWLIYAAIMVVVFMVLFRDSNVVGAIAGVLISGPLYVGIGGVMAKFGYSRKRLKELRIEAREARENDRSSSRSAKSRSSRRRSDDTEDEPGVRPRPAPTSRTSGGGSNRPKSSSKRKR